MLVDVVNRSALHLVFPTASRYAYIHDLGRLTVSSLLVFLEIVILHDRGIPRGL